MHYRTARATMDDWDKLEGLRHQVEARLRAKGISQWTDSARGLEQLARHVDRDDVYLVTDGQRLAGCFALTWHYDKDFWAADPERGRFVYLHKVMTSPLYAGRGVGGYIVHNALTKALLGRALGVRLDCWKDNAALRRRWEQLGFTYLRTEEVPGRRSGVLMEQRLPEPSRR